MREIRAEIELTAPVERIWELLTDLRLYPQWNPLFLNAEGKLNAGARLKLKVKLPGIEQFTIAPTVLAIVPPTELCWLHRIRFPGLFGWEHSFTIEPLGADRLRFTQRSIFRGVLAPLFAIGLGAAVRQGCETLNAAMKRWGEKGSIQCLKC